MAKTYVLVPLTTQFLKVKWSVSERISVTGQLPPKLLSVLSKVI